MAVTPGEYIGVSELAAAVGEALSEIGETDRRMKSGATEIPTERTIRFYLEKGLLPKPSKRLGQTLVFGRVHLLHLLVIKKLQADGVPLSAIPDVLKKRGKTETQLQEFLDDLGFVGSIQELDAFQQRTGRIEDVDSLKQVAEPIWQSGAESPEPPQAPASGAKSYLKSLLSRSSRSQARQPTQRKTEEPIDETFYSVSPPPDFEEPVRWARYEPAVGLEVSISGDYEIPDDEQGKAKLLEKLRQILGL